MKLKLLGGVNFVVKAVNQERLFSLLSKTNNVYNVKRSSHTQAEFSVKLFDEKEVATTLKKCNVEVVKKKPFGLFSRVLNLAKQVGIITGLIIGIAFGVISTNFVFQTKVEGLEKITAESFNRVLAENNVTGFKFKGSINAKQIEEKLMQEFDNISLVSAIIKGNTLLISVKEKLSAGDYDDLDALKPMLSNYSGIITKINLIQGTLKVKIGQLVKTGDVLVEPYIIDASGEQKKVKAEAEVIARVWYRGRETHHEKSLQIIKTGNTYKHINIYFLNISLTQALPKDIFKNYEVTITTTQVSQNNFLPIVREEIFLEETNQIEVNEKFEEVRDKIFLKAKEKALKLVEEYDIISKEFFTINSNLGVTTVEYVIEVEKPLA